MAWTPPSLPDSIVLLGGYSDKTELTAEIVPGISKRSKKRPKKNPPPRLGFLEKSWVESFVILTFGQISLKRNLP